MLNDILDRINSRLKALDLKESKAAKMAGLSDSAIRNMRRAVESGKSQGASTETLAKLAPVLNTTLSWLIDGKGIENLDAGEETLSRVPGDLKYIKILGRVAANTWLDVENTDFDYDHMADVPSVSGYPPHLQFALVVAGNCLNKIAANGDILVCLNTIGAQVEPIADDLVIVERKRFGGQMIERTAKRLRKSTYGFELWPESIDPVHQEPIRLNAAEMNEGDEIQIIGKVLWILRKP